MPFDLDSFSLVEMLQCGRGIRQAAAAATSLEQAARSIVEYLYRELGHDQPSRRPTALIRFYKTRPFAELEPSLQTFATRVGGGVALEPTTRCLTLVATAGLEPEWCDTSRSVGHQAIPLPSEN